MADEKNCGCGRVNCGNTPGRQEGEYLPDDNKSVEDSVKKLNSDQGRAEAPGYES